MFRTIGPGAILLGTAIGGGEWLMGPIAVTKYGLSILSIAVIAIFLQAQLNLELVRYTIYTGEPVITGFIADQSGTAFLGRIVRRSCLVSERLGVVGWDSRRCAGGGHAGPLA